MEIEEKIARLVFQYAKFIDDKEIVHKWFDLANRERWFDCAKQILALIKKQSER